ncbi:hypothetical protein ABN267_17615 [Providencia rettgeri]
MTGLQYDKDCQSDNVNHFTKKFRKKIQYANKYFGDYEKHFMFWSPIVKNQGESAKNNQIRDIEEILQNLRAEFGVKLEPIINQLYFNYLSKLREYAAKETKELKSPILRLMQIEEKLAKHVSKLNV